MSVDNRADTAQALSSLPTGKVASIQPARSNLSASLRAAVIITMLGERAAKPIVEKLDDKALAKVASEIENISFISREEMASIVSEFLTRLREASGALRGSREKAREVLSGVLNSERLIAIFGDPETEESDAVPEAIEPDDPWARLAKRDPREIAAYLAGLSANMIALILSKLDTSVTSDILSLMDIDKISPVIGFMVEKQIVDPSVDQVLAQMVELEFLNNSDTGSNKNDDHLAEIGELLSLIPTDKRDTLVAFLTDRYKDKLGGIQKSLFTFESLPTLLPHNMIPVIFRELDENATITLLASLRTDYSDISEFFLSNISSRLADKLRDELGDVRDPSPAESEIAQRDFLSLLMQLKRLGKIELNTPEEVGADSADAA